MRNLTLKKFSPAKVVTGVAVGAAAIMSGSAFAGTMVADSLNAGIDKADLLAGGAVILAACAVIAFITLGKRTAR